MMVNILSCPSPNFDDRAGGQPPSMIIIHYTGTPTAEEARLRFCDPAPADTIGRIAPHYMIDGDANILQFVDEGKRAWHAGRAAWGACSDINSASIGIEIWNTGHEYDFEEFLPDQMDAVIALIRDIRTRWDIPDRHILGHSDVAPGRKLDPGEKFPWAQLAAAGIGLMPRGGAQALSHDDFFSTLKAYGYTYSDDPAVILREFRRHFLPARLDAGDVGEVELNALASLRWQAAI